MSTLVCKHRNKLNLPKKFYLKNENVYWIKTALIYVIYIFSNVSVHTYILFIETIIIKYAKTKLNLIYVLNKKVLQKIIICVH